MYRNYRLKALGRELQGEPSTHTINELRRKWEEHEKLKELSRYYRLGGRLRVWEGPALLKRGESESGPDPSLHQLHSGHSPALLLVLSDMKELFID